MVGSVADPWSSRRFGHRLQQARVEAGLSQARLAEMLGVSTRLITYYEAGSKLPPVDRLEVVARITQKPISWFFDAAEGGRPPAPRTRLTVGARPGGGPIPLYDEVPAGSSTEAIQQAQGQVDVPAHWIRERAELYALRVKGHSMEPLIREGDLVVVRRQPHAESGQIVIAGLPGDAESGNYALKRFLVRRGKVVLRSENAAYADIVPDGPVFIDGLVVGLIRTL